MTFISISTTLIEFLGIGIILTRGNLFHLQFFNLWTDLVVLTGAFSFALFSVISKKNQEDEYITTVLYFFGGILLSTFSLLLLSHFSLPSRSEIIPVIINGAFTNGISYILWLKALSLIPASIAAILVFFYSHNFHISYCYHLS